MARVCQHRNTKAKRKSGNGKGKGRERTLLSAAGTCGRHSAPSLPALNAGLLGLQAAASARPPAHQPTSPAHMLHVYGQTKLTLPAPLLTSDVTSTTTKALDNKTKKQKTTTATRTRMTTGSNYNPERPKTTTTKKREREIGKTGNVQAAKYFR